MDNGERERRCGESNVWRRHLARRRGGSGVQTGNNDGWLREDNGRRNGNGGRCNGGGWVGSGDRDCFKRSGTGWRQNIACIRSATLFVVFRNAGGCGKVVYERSVRGCARERRSFRAQDRRDITRRRGGGERDRRRGDCWSRDGGSRRLCRVAGNGRGCGRNRRNGRGGFRFRLGNRRRERHGSRDGGDLEREIFTQRRGGGGRGRRGGGGNGGSDGFGKFGMCG